MRESFAGPGAGDHVDLPRAAAGVSRRPVQGAIDIEMSDERNHSHANSPISASACSSQKRMSISRYIVDAVVRCSRACSRWPVRRWSLPRPAWQWAEGARRSASPEVEAIADDHLDDHAV